MNRPAQPDRLRILILAPFAPRFDMTHGGGRVLASFLSRLCLRHEVALQYMRSPTDPPVDHYFTEHCYSLAEVQRPWAGTSRLQKALRGARLLAALARGIPLWVADWQSRDFAHRVRQAVQEFQPDIIQIEYHVMAQYLLSLSASTAPRILVEYEPGSLSAPYIKNGPPALIRWIHHRDQAAWASFEPAAIAGVQAVIAFTPKDQQAIKAYRLPTPVTCIPFGVEIPDKLPETTVQPAQTLLFIGNFQHPPNQEAALRLIQNIYPALKDRFPGLVLQIVGPEPPPAVRKSAGSDIQVTGWVPAVAPYLERATVFAAPIFSGGGMRVKILEAMAAGKAIVATPLAVEGLDICDGEQVLLASTDEEMIDRISRLLADNALRSALAGRARAWAADHLGWERVMDAYEAVYWRLLEKKEC